MDFSIRTATPAEQMYSYSQSGQIEAQTGCIGHLRADFDSDGNSFYSSWADHNASLKDQAFKDEFDHLINTLRGLEPRLSRHHSAAEVAPGELFQYAGGHRGADCHHQGRKRLLAHGCIPAEHFPKRRCSCSECCQWCDQSAGSGNGGWFHVRLGNACCKPQELRCPRTANQKPTAFLRCGTIERKHNGDHASEVSPW